MSNFMIVFFTILGSSYGYIAKGYFEGFARSWMASSVTTVAPAPVGDTILITGIIDGPVSAGPDALELYVGQDIPDLSIYGLGTANNGGGTDGVEFTFPAVSVTAGTFIYVASQEANFMSFLGFAPDYTDPFISITGDDAVELFENGVVIDRYGEADVDGTGQSWEYTDGWGYRASGKGAFTFFVASDWDNSGPNALDGETTNADAANPWPIRRYTP